MGASSVSRTSGVDGLRPTPLIVWVWLVWYLGLSCLDSALQNGHYQAASASYRACVERIDSTKSPDVSLKKMEDCGREQIRYLREDGPRVIGISTGWLVPVAQFAPWLLIGWRVRRARSGGAGGPSSRGLDARLG